MIKGSKVLLFSLNGKQICSLIVESLTFSKWQHSLCDISMSRQVIYISPFLYMGGWERNPASSCFICIDAYMYIKCMRAFLYPCSWSVSPCPWMCMDKSIHLPVCFMVFYVSAINSFISCCLLTSLCKLPRGVLHAVHLSINSSSVRCPWSAYSTLPELLQKVWVFCFFSYMWTISTFFVVADIRWCWEEGKAQRRCVWV